MWRLGLFLGRICALKALKIGGDRIRVYKFSKRILTFLLSWKISSTDLWTLVKLNLNPSASAQVARKRRSDRLSNVQENRAS